MHSNAYVRVTNNFLHDMATGTWAASLMVLVVLNRSLPGMPQEAAMAIGDAMLLVFWLLIGALIVVTVTGALRLFYWRATTTPDELVAKRRALIVKHIVFFVIYGGGTVWAWMLLP